MRKILLTSICRPLGERYGDGPSVGYELLFGPVTRAQVLSIDTHFLIEQNGRSRSGWPLPFNGTGGVWRAATIRGAGGWSAATLTEDLDLSIAGVAKGGECVHRYSDLPGVTIAPRGPMDEGTVVYTFIALVETADILCIEAVGAGKVLAKVV